MNTKNKEKILVGLSGGVDSAVAAYLLQKEGYEVEAAFMKNFSDKVNLKGECPWKEDKLTAYKVAAFLKIPIRTFNFEKEYKDKVVNYIFTSYKKGLTPNPDILCNNEIKFKLFLNKALELGFNKIATGHYAGIEENDGYTLLRGRDNNKDQSYFLAGLNQKQLSKVIFPLQDIDKKEVRRIAKEIKLPNANRKDSQGICFIGKLDLKTFLQQKIKEKKGEIVDKDNNVLGYHQGVWYYTIGQRKGLDIGGSGPWYIIEKDLKNNKLIVGKIDDPELYHKEIKCINWHWLNKEYKFPLKAKAQIRYRQKAEDVKIEKKEDYYLISFKNKQKGVASGQILAVYDKNKLIASALIT